MQFGMYVHGPYPTAKSDSEPPPSVTVEDFPEISKPKKNRFAEEDRIFRLRWKSWYEAGNRFYLEESIKLNLVYYDLRYVSYTVRGVRRASVWPILSLYNEVALLVYVLMRHWVLANFIRLISRFLLKSLLRIPSASTLSTYQDLS